MSVQMSVQDDVAKIVTRYATQNKIEKGASLDRFLRMGISRHNALARFASGDTEPKKAAKAKPAAKAPAKK